MSETFKRARTVLAQHLDIDPETITGNSIIVDDLGADSLDLVELVMACEEEFGVEISDDDMEAVKTVGDMVEAIDRAAGK